jgi:hypothetical protein
VILAFICPIRSITNKNLLSDPVFTKGFGLAEDGINGGIALVGGIAVLLEEAFDDDADVLALGPVDGDRSCERR